MFVGTRSLFSAKSAHVSATSLDFSRLNLWFQPGCGKRQKRMNGALIAAPVCQSCLFWTSLWTWQRKSTCNLNGTAALKFRSLKAHFKRSLKAHFKSYTSYSAAFWKNAKSANTRTALQAQNESCSFHAMNHVPTWISPWHKRTLLQLDLLLVMLERVTSSTVKNSDAKIPLKNQC